MFCKIVNVKQFFLSYNNINIYKKVQDSRVHNKNYLVICTTSYMCFIKSPRPLFYYTIEYKAINKLKPKDFLFTPTEFQH